METITIIAAIAIAILVILAIVTAMPNNEESQPQDEVSISLLQNSPKN